jgi:hydroxyacylglutathione hydrolase
MLEIVPLILGPLETNTYLVADPGAGEAAVIDPAWDGSLIAAEANQRNWRIRQVWITHAHFDHMGGAADLVHAMEQPPVIALHPDDRLLWDSQGDSDHFGISLPASPIPTLALADGMLLRLGQADMEVRHTPGHTPGHCVLYCAQAGACFCGDLIFQDSVGRTDLPGGDWAALLSSIRSKIFTLPDKTRLLPGHGPATTVGREKRHNPFLRY